MTTVVIGGGAAGMTAAIFAAEGSEVICLERNDRPGVKLGITGKGRCNLTNNSDNENILRNIPVNGRFLYSALAGFSAYDTMELFQSRLGVPLKTERGRRVFPVSDRAGDIVSALKAECERLGVKFIKCRADKIHLSGGAVCAVSGGGQKFDADAVILATGGVSYPATGSTGDGYKIAGALGHTIVPPKAMLVPMETIEDCAPLSGLTLKNVSLTLKAKSGKTLYKEQGEMLFTHFGISGPLVLSASGYMREQGCTVEIDLKPALSDKTLDARILRDIGEEKNRQMSNLLKKLLPQVMIPEVLRRAEIEPTLPANSLTRTQRAALVGVLKAYKLSIKGLRPVEEGIITDGGISVKEIDPKTMQSRLIRGLYFAGEIIDVAAYTGGYNLQIAFSTAHSAGTAVWREDR